jgi:uncharacterized membrane protein
MQNRTPMDRDAAEVPATGPIFAATLVPEHALPPEGLRALLFNVAALSYLSVFVFFALSGGWLAALWCFDAALCYAVYFWKYRPGRLSERVEITDGMLSLTRTDSAGRVQSFDFNPYWVRCEHQQADNELWLTSHGSKFAFGAFLSGREKARIASALSGALISNRTRTPVECAKS